MTLLTPELKDLLEDEGAGFYGGDPVQFDLMRWARAAYAVLRRARPYVQQANHAAEAKHDAYGAFYMDLGQPSSPSA
jgi:hypothetical protein